MGTVPQSYYDFVMHYAPYYYVKTTAMTSSPPSGQKNVAVANGANFQAGYPVQIYDNNNSEWNVVASVNGNTLTMQNNLQNTYYTTAGGSVDGPDPAYGQGAFPAAFAIDFLYLAYSAPQFAVEQAAILAEITTLANFLVAQQCTNSSLAAYGGFQSSVGSNQYWAVDACRCIPSLLRAYALTNNPSYLAAAQLAGLTFLYNMQHQPAVLGLHDHYYGGFAESVNSSGVWSAQMDVECLYGCIGLMMLAGTYDAANAAVYNQILSDLTGFLSQGFSQLYLDFTPLPSGDDNWHRVGSPETQIYDDSMAFALLGLFTYEGWSATCQQVYGFIQTIRASAQYPAYNPFICWSGYIDVVQRFPACAYYDAITIGILGQIRKAHDKPSYALAMQIISQYQAQFMNWGPQFIDYSAITPQKAMANVSWLGEFYLNYIDPVTDFTQLLDLNGDELQLFPIQEAANEVTWGQPITLLGMVTMGATSELILEPGYISQKQITVHSFLPTRVHDKIRYSGEDYEVITVSDYDLDGDPLFYKSVCKRLITQ